VLALHGHDVIVLTSDHTHITKMHTKLVCHDFIVRVEKLESVTFLVTGLRHLFHVLLQVIYKIVESSILQGHPHLTPTFKHVHRSLANVPVQTVGLLCSNNCYGKVEVGCEQGKEACSTHEISA
jgi:hypothetical protein